MFVTFVNNFVDGVKFSIKNSYCMIQVTQSLRKAITLRVMRQVWTAPNYYRHKIKGHRKLNK